MPEPVLIEERPDHRRALVRRAALLTPGAIAATAVLLYATLHLPGSILIVILVGLSTLAVDIEAIAALRDLRAQPVTTEGRVDRIWKKSRFLFFGRIDYMLVDRALFEIGAITATELHEGDEVVVEHWPHSHIVISLARKATVARPGTPASDRAAGRERP